MNLLKQVLFICSLFLLFENNVFTTESGEKKLVLVTGGAGYIGSHVCVTLLNNDYKVIVIDNLENSNAKSIERIKSITGKDDIELQQYDMTNKELLFNIFTNNNISAVIHLAGLKAVGESVKQPLLYYQNNLISGMNLLDAMTKFNVNKLIFSSSATVYGEPQTLPFNEEHPINPTNPYGHTKAMFEQMMKDYSNANKGAKFISLRYFNPIGAHESGLIGEDPNSQPNNLVPYILKVISDDPDYSELNIFGDDYETIDGTGVRDYIHVMDLAEGHVAALKYLNTDFTGFTPINLGTGTGYSVLKIVEEFEEQGKEVPYQIVSRRDGDIAEMYADPKLAKDILGWESTRGLPDMIKDSLNWLEKNPNGYGD